MKKRLKRWLSVVSVLAMLFCLTPPVTADTDPQDESPFVDIDTLPDNIRTLLDLNNTGNVGGVPGRSAAPAAEAPLLQVVNTDDLNSIRVEDSSGNGTAKVFGVPVRYEDDEGETHFIDTSMAGESLLTSLIDGYDYRNAANSFSVQYSKKPDKGIRVDKAFTMAVYNPEKEKLPKGYTDQTTEGYGRMVYPQAFGEHTYIEYINTNTGVKENIVLEENTGRNRFDFVFASEEYLPVLTEDGLTVQIVRKDNPEEILYRLTSLYVYDSYQPEATGPEEEPSREPVFVGPGTAEYAEEELPEVMGPAPVKHYTEDNHYEVEALGDGKYRITSVVSADFLNSPDTVYPVTIDPSLGSTDSNSQDSYVWEAEPDGKYGSLNYIRFGKDNGGKIYGYHRFNQLPALPDKVNITDGWLKFTFRSGQTTGADGICRIVDSKQWYESNITWNTQPYGNWGFTSSHHNFQYYEFYMKPFLEMWVNGDYRNYGVMFTYNNMISDYNSVVSSEGEAHRAPTLTYTYTTALTMASGSSYVGQLGQGGHHWYKFTPTASRKYVFYTNGPTDTYGELYYGAQRLAVNDDSGEGSNFQLEYTLTAGLTYYLKVRGYNYDRTGSYSVCAGKKAIIIIPGIMGSELYANQNISIPGGIQISNGTRLWDPSTSDLSIVGDKIRGLKCNLNGDPLYITGSKANLLINSNPDQIQNQQFGAQDVYRNIYLEMYNQFYSSFDIVLFEHDWRKDLVTLGEELSILIGRQGYGKVILVAHSMGGLVASQYLALGETERQKVERYISVGAPYLGAAMPIGVYLDGRFLRGKGVWGNLQSLVGNVAVQAGVKEVFPNISTFYSLLPPSQHFSPYLYHGICAYTVNNGYVPVSADGPFTTYTDTMEYLSKGLNSWNATLMHQAQEASKKVFINGQHVTLLLGSKACYIVGYGESTPSEIVCYKTDPSSKIKMHLLKENTIANGSYKAGDGTVSLWSATIGGTTGNRTFYKRDHGYYGDKPITSDHLGMISGKFNSDTSGTVKEDKSTIDFITQIIKGNENSYEDYLFTKTSP